MGVERVLRPLEGVLNISPSWSKTLRNENSKGNVRGQGIGERPGCRDEKTYHPRSLILAGSGLHKRGPPLRLAGSGLHKKGPRQVLGNRICNRISPLGSLQVAKGLNKHGKS